MVDLLEMRRGEEVLASEWKLIKQKQELFNGQKRNIVIFGELILVGFMENGIK